MEQPNNNVMPSMTTEQRLSALRGLDDKQPLTELLAGDLVVTYVVDTGQERRLVRTDDLEALGISADEIMDRALADLTDDLSEVQLGEHSHLMMVQTGADLEACTLLLAGLWDQLAEQLDGDVAVGAPSTDIVLIADSASTEAMDELRRAAAQLHDPNAPNGLSAQLFVWRNGRWDVL